ncbi:MAG: hypothetical protein WCT99_02500 [Bacteroidota bacterium]|jgi:hypothetical protein
MQNDRNWTNPVLMLIAFNIPRSRLFFFALTDRLPADEERKPDDGITNRYVLLPASGAL